MSKNDKNIDAYSKALLDKKIYGFVKYALS